MEITQRDRFWMNCKVAQVWRFVMLNVKILRAAHHHEQAAHLPVPGAGRHMESEQQHRDGQLVAG